MIFTENSISQQKNRDVKVVSRTFQVSDVEKSNELLPSRSYNEIIKGKMIEPKRAPLPKFEATAKKILTLSA